MASEYSSFIAEINEELKRDQSLKFLKKYQNTISWILIVIIAGIVIQSSLYSKKKKQLEQSTTSLYNEIYSSEHRDKDGIKKSQAVLENLSQNAPSEIVPIIELIRNGRDLSDPDKTAEAQKQLLAISENKKIDIVWRDIAVLMYVSYRKESNEKCIERLEKLTEEGRPFRLTALEKIAMIYVNQNNYDKAINILDDLVENKLTPDTMKQRIKKVVNYLKNHKDNKANKDQKVKTSKESSSTKK